MRTTSLTIGEVRARFRDLAADSHINPRDVDLLLGDALNRPITFLISHGEEPVDADAAAQFEAQFRRRLNGEPLQYIRGRCEFYGREFHVDPRAFIPRPETEFVVEAAIDHAPRNSSVIDIGTGSGCIAITIERERPDLRVYAVDLSLGSVAVARANARRLGSAVRFIASNLLGSIRGTFGAIVSNPPYVPADQFEQLQREVRMHEPKLALTPGGDGLSIIDQLLASDQSKLLIMEIGYKQIEAVAARAEASGWTLVESRDDLAAIPRVVVLSR